MCLSNKVEVSIERVEAYKLFYHEDNDGLRSFYRQPAKTPDYETNKLLSVSPSDSFFYAFKTFNNCFAGIRDTRYFNYAMVLPVTLLDVRYTGTFVLRSNVHQCLDGHYDAYMSKQIIVHDSKEHRKKYYETALEILCKYDSARRTVMNFTKMLTV